MGNKAVISYKEYMDRENNEFHAPYEQEFQFYVAVKMGDIENVIRLLNSNPMNKKEGLGKLSKNPLTSLKYHFAISAAMVARYCIEGDMLHETAFLLSDYYISRADLCDTIEEISKLLFDMMIDYTNRMLECRKIAVCSKKINRCIDFIYENLHTKISVEELAKHVGLSQSYLSKLFKKEQGITISEYILHKKLETSKNMLMYSEYSIADIASVLAFSSQSYFTEVFHKNYGETPKDYRNQNFKSLFK